jgi:hypothetical protein
MAARILHFGTDDCKRINVLRGAGYDIDTCSSLTTLDTALQDRPEPDAVVIPGVVPTPARHRAVTLVHSRSSAPLVLFESGICCPDEFEFDLVIPTFTPAEEWLETISQIIEASRALHAQSISIRERSAKLSRETKAFRQRSALERWRSARLISWAKELLANSPAPPGKKPPGKS